jgi:hypothetical protein
MLSDRSRLRIKPLKHFSGSLQQVEATTTKESLCEKRPSDSMCRHMSTHVTRKGRLRYGARAAATTSALPRARLRVRLEDEFLIPVCFKPCFGRSTYSSLINPVPRALTDAHIINAPVFQVGIRVSVA